MDRLEVWLGGRRAGHLRRAEGGGLAFRYDGDFLDDRGRRALSASLPLDPTPVVRGAATTYFRGLLPGAAVRATIALKLGIDVDDDLALLGALGGECPGAVSLQPEGVDPTVLRRDYARFETADLAELSASGQRVALLTGRTRATLPGEQPKLPVVWREGQLWLPVGPAPTTHILKLPVPGLAHLPANEAFTTLFAAELGLRVPRIRLLATGGEPALLAERFDRGPGASVERLHQESFAQAAGPRPGDPPYSLAEAIRILRDHTAVPLAETHRLLVWFVFHLISGDSGAAPENLALLHSDDGPPHLAPFYDLVCTRAYRALDRHLGITIAGESDPIRIGRDQWSALAKDIGVREKTLLELVARTLDEAEPALGRAEHRFHEEHGDHPILRVVPVMRDQIAWVRDRLG